MQETETIRELCSRKSVRVFSDEPITPQERDTILSSALQAPSAGNQLLYTVIDVTDAQKKAALADSCDHQPFIAQAQLVLVFCADPLKWHDAYRLFGCDPRPLGAGDLMLSVIDAAIAAQNAVTAAWSLGIGSCYIGDILENRETQREILRLPAQVMPAVMCVFGRPAESQLSRPKPPRPALTRMVHENEYRRMDEAALKELLSYHFGTDAFEDRLRAFWQRKYESDFSREMTRSVAEWIKAFSG